MALNKGDYRTYSPLKLDKPTGYIEPREASVRGSMWFSRIDGFRVTNLKSMINGMLQEAFTYRDLADLRAEIRTACENAAVVSSLITYPSEAEIMDWFTRCGEEGTWVI